MTYFCDKAYPSGYVAKQNGYFSQLDATKKVRLYYGGYASS